LNLLSEAALAFFRGQGTDLAAYLLQVEDQPALDLLVIA